MQYYRIMTLLGSEVSQAFPDEERANTGPNFVTLCVDIRAGDPAAMATLDRLLHRGMRYYLRRQLGSVDLEDRLHDTFLAVVHAIQRDEIREPAKLMSFVYTVVRHQIARSIGRAIQDRQRHPADNQEQCRLVTDGAANPEQAAILAERAALVQSALRTLKEQDRQILIRFYLLEQEPAQICRDLSLTENQFRNSKSRSKARLGRIGQQSLDPKRSRLPVFRKAAA